MTRDSSVIFLERNTPGNKQRLLFSGSYSPERGSMDSSEPFGEYTEVYPLEFMCYHAVRECVLGH